jgi:hypothetical protein
VDTIFGCVAATVAPERIGKSVWLGRRPTLGSQKSEIVFTIEHRLVQASYLRKWERLHLRRAAAAMVPQGTVRNPQDEECEDININIVRGIKNNLVRDFAI